MFSEKECQEWWEQTQDKKCCKAPDYVIYLKQDRAIDEMPNRYKQCKNCLRIIKKKDVK